MDFQAFGPLTVTDEGAARPITRYKCRALLGLLLAGYPDGVTPDAVADALWPDADPAKAANSVRVHTTYLRRALGSVSDLVVLTGGRYRLAVDPDAIDLHRFRLRCQEAHRQADAGSPSSACAMFERAFAEWRGAPLDEFADLGAIRNEIVRLEALRLEALERYSAALLDDDRPDQVCRLVDPIMHEHLTREVLAARLMLARSRTGRRRDALALFGEVKLALAEELGLPPSNELQGLADMIIMHDTQLDPGPVGSARAVVHQHRRRAEFTGRANELQTLERIWEQAVTGTPRLAYVVGRAGMGKTAMVTHFADRLGRTGVQVFRGSCDPDPGHNYQPFPELVRRVLELAPPSHTSPEVLAELSRLTPELAARLPAAGAVTDPEAGRQRLFGAVTNLLATASRPRLLIVEDLHWARPDAVLMLRHLVRSAVGPVMVVGTYRGINESSAFAGAIRSGRLGRPDATLTLEGLSRAEVIAVIDAVAPGPLRAEWIAHADELLDVSAGSPLHLREVLRQLELEPDTPIGEIAPDDVRTLVARRLRALDDGTRHTIYAAATLGRDFTIRDLAAVVDRPETVVLTAVERAQQVGLVEETDRVDEFTFSHPLLRNACYHDMSQTRQARYHHACARLLSERAEEPGSHMPWSDIARNLVASDAVADRRETVRACTEAGAEAARRFAHHEAVTWFDHAIEQAIIADFPPIEVAAIRIELGRAREKSGDTSAGRAEYFSAADTARRFGDNDLLIKAAVAAIPKESILDPDFGPMLSRLTEDALAVLEGDDPRRAQLLLGIAQALTYYRPERVPSIAEDARRLAERTGDPAARYTVYVIDYLAAMGTPAANRLTLSYEARDYARRHGLTNDLGTASRRLLAELFVVGAADEIRIELAELGRLARVASTPQDLYWSAAFEATRALMDEPNATAEELIEAAALLGRRLQVYNSTGTHLLQTFALRYQQGRSREITQHLATPSRDAPQVRAGTALLALALADAERFDTARQMLDQVIDGDTITLPRDNFRVAGVALFAGVAAACGTAHQRAILRRHLGPFAAEFCVFGAGAAVFGTNHHWLGRLAAADSDRPGAIEHFRRAEQLCQHSGAAFWARRARDELGSLEGQGTATP